MPKLDTAARIAHSKGLTIDALYDIIRKYRKMKVDESDPKSGQNAVMKARKTIRKTGGVVDSPLRVDIDDKALRPVTLKERFEMFNGE